METMGRKTTKGDLHSFPSNVNEKKNYTAGTGKLQKKKNLLLVKMQMRAWRRSLKPRTPGPQETSSDKGHKTPPKTDSRALGQYFP